VTLRASLVPQTRAHKTGTNEAPYCGLRLNGD